VSTMATPPLDVKLMNLSTLVLGLVFVVLVLSVVVRTVSHMRAFDIRAIKVNGQVLHSNAVTLRANVAPRISGSFFTVDLGRVSAAFQAVPWVRKAVAHREFPNRLRVELQEHVAVAYWGADSDSQLINSYGEVFEANVGEVEQDMLPRLDGPLEQSAEVLAMYRALAPLFDSLELPIEEFELTGRGSWRALLDTGAKIELGRGSVEEVTARVRMFLKTLTQVSSVYGRQANAVESADLRHENGYAIRLRGVSTQVADGAKK